MQDIYTFTEMHSTSMKQNKLSERLKQCERKCAQSAQNEIKGNHQDQ